MQDLSERLSLLPEDWMTANIMQHLRNINDRQVNMKL